MEKQAAKEEKIKRRADRARRKAGLVGMGIAVTDDEDFEERRKSDSSLVTVREEQMTGGISVPAARPPTPPRKLGKGKNASTGTGHHHHHHHHLGKSGSRSNSAVKLDLNPNLNSNTKPPSSILTKSSNQKNSKAQISSQTQFLGTWTLYLILMLNLLLRTKGQLLL